MSSTTPEDEAQDSVQPVDDPEPVGDSDPVADPDSKVWQGDPAGTDAEADESASQ